ncbi:MAG: serine threonine [Lasallia pustulata]|uniref:non-specific serine/threonine protein kinase n=1 Tax=Lasallia pustulata TaxID=136370 RepID=A0A5M8PZ05_9LECA|nr:MAG: serine threonine [Lasallia pustulata]
MEGDLSLSQSLGGLRIANPDDASSSSLRDEPSNIAPTISPLSISPSPMDANSQGLQVASPSQMETTVRSISPLGFDPNLYSTESLPMENPLAAAGSRSPPLPSSPRKQSYEQRKNNRDAMPQTYQAQQQAQFPQYPTMIPQNQRYPGSSSRPASVIYPQSNARGINGAGSPKDGSYRVRSDSSRSSIAGLPHRSTSRGSSAVMPTGIPSGEDSHIDRSYRGQNHQIRGGNGPLPPRRSLRGMGTGQLNPSAGAPTSDPPYGMEGGPMASSEEWQERGAAVGVRQELDAHGRPVSRYVKKGVKDFKFGRTLGEGSYSTVMAATDRQTLKEYAIKVLDKRHIIKEKKVKYVNIEKDTLNRLTDHPGVVRLYYTFQDEASLYFVLDLASGGELLGVLKKMTTFDEECTRFYGAQILDTVDYMHARGVIHRDLKPENVLLDSQMHVKITDFGTAKILDVPNRSQNGTNGPAAGNPMDGATDNRANSFVGTAEYVSPELLTDKNACKASDLWAFGCIIYQLLAGRPPFKAGNEYQTFQKIVALDYVFPDGFPAVAKDLVERLLVLDPSRRLSIDHIKNHEFFRGITWGRGLWTQKAPRLKSYVPRSSDITLANSNAMSNGSGNGYPSNVAPAHSTKAAHIGTNASVSAGRPTPRVITELPPPSQLDIEWSPVLTRNNERILKLGNVLVLSAPAPHSPNSRNGGHSSDADSSKRFSRFFGGSTTKKRQRLVMVTSSARVIIAAAGGDEKKSKTEISLLGPGCTWRRNQDPKGLTFWCIETRDKHFTFEDPKSASSDGSSTALSAQEWLDAIERAKEIAISHSLTRSYSGEDAFRDLRSGPNSASPLDDDRRIDSGQIPAGRNTLQKHHPSPDTESMKGRKRFSRRQSKNGLAAVF